jgi:hypothetical protein
MAPNPVDPSDVEARWRPLTPEENTVVGSLLDDAWALMQIRVPAVATAEAGSVGEALIRSVMVAMILRVLKNPDGAKSETIDDYSFTRDDSNATGGLYLSDDDVELLRGFSPPRAAVVSMDSWA